jgi:spore maturation protein CgeB
MTPGYKKNEAFRQIPPIAQFWKIFGKEEIVAPQLKSRTFEAAFSRSLILCKKDPFNVIERYFEPGKEFIYYTNDTLESTIRDILNNNDRYAIIAENAYQRACQSYTSRKFCEKYIQCG